MPEPTVPTWHRPGACDWCAEDLAARGVRRSDARFCGGACRARYAAWRAAMEDGSEYPEPPGRRATKRRNRRPRPGASVYLTPQEISSIVGAADVPDSTVDKLISARRRAAERVRAFDSR